MKSDVYFKEMSSTRVFKYATIEDQGRRRMDPRRSKAIRKIAYQFTINNLY
ncbi:hypothetical protein [Paenibacillus sp. JZ16]|uniref:hypothetical protein n=1 Tax=Paenibacillus sp. JZ16 TaxID=1906272 RepID=UPI00188C6F3D|nr:hypothetical protein [Paenibacillus sp. JZ16]